MGVDSRGGKAGTWARMKWMGGVNDRQSFEDRSLVE